MTERKPRIVHLQERGGHSTPVLRPHVHIELPPAEEDYLQAHFTKPKKPEDPVYDAGRLTSEKWIEWMKEHINFFNSLPEPRQEATSEFISMVTEGLDHLGKLDEQTHDYARISMGRRLRFLDKVSASILTAVLAKRLTDNSRYTGEFTKEMDKIIDEEEHKIIQGLGFNSKEEIKMHKNEKNAQLDIKPADIIKSWFENRLGESIAQ